MKKVKKAILILLAFIGCLWLLLHGHKYHIKTEYGDSFTVFCDDFGDLYSICDDNSDFSTGLYYFSDKKQLQAMCDNQYIRCYHILDGREDGYKDKYIFKIKKDDVFFAVRYSDVKSPSEYMFENDAERVKNNFLCDINLMKICIYDLDYHYHKEMQEMAKKLTSGDYEGLEQYGLTQEMINDRESLDEKIRIMEDYLKNNK